MFERKNERIDYTLPVGKPVNWPKSTEAEVAVLPQREIHVNESQKFQFLDNHIKTSKYETYSFLPLFLMEEFNPHSKVANCYFLMIAALQCIGPISNTNGLPTFLIPLSIVVAIDAAFQALEDVARHHADNQANSHPVHMLDINKMEFKPVKSMDVCVGDFIRIDNRDTIPADVIIIAVAEKKEPAEGVCYVETKQLDGETNLKTRFALPNTAVLIDTKEKLKMLSGHITMEHPNNLIDSFTGIIDLSSSNIRNEDNEELEKVPVMSQNLLLRGCVLRNTEWVYGLVVNTGHDTKIMMSSTTGKVKTSSLESAASIEIRKIIMMLLTFCFIGACAQVGTNDSIDIKDIWYLDYSDYNAASNWFVMFFYFFLLHASMIPVSLYVSMSITRAGQMYFMNKDLDMYYERLDAPCAVRTMNLNEDLGRVSHIFSDKTGTLTSNIMDFRKMSVNGVIYGKGITEIGKASWKLRGKEIPDYILTGETLARERSVPHVSFYDNDYERLMEKNNWTTDEEYQVSQNRLFFKILALCHDTVVEHTAKGPKFSASNPDDEALVAAGAYFGESFTDRQDKHVLLTEMHQGIKKENKIDILNIIKFTSKRKRLSVTIRDIDGKIKLLMKGADTMMVGRIRDEDQKTLLPTTMRHVEDFSGEGLRCLLLGWKEINEEEWNTWSHKYKAATSDLDQIALAKDGKPNDIEDLESEIEMGCALVGSTALEDKLQDGVPECIAKLAESGIVMWILTGDKEETAINIAIACNLVQPEVYMDQIIINEKTCPTPEAMRARFYQEIRRCEDKGNNKPQALIIDGPSLITAMEPPPDDYKESEPSLEEKVAEAKLSTNGETKSHRNSLKDLLLRLTKSCKAVVACRVSPDQKREMVNLIRFGSTPQERVLTLAIGDGANDVPMIQGAHVGVGIRGEEGQQAVNSSDYAIAQFRFLQPLLLKHGRYNYVRMSNVISFTFYKNVLLNVTMYMFNFYCAFSGQKFYSEPSIQTFNIFATSIPILLYGIYDRDIDVDLVYEFPKLYESRKYNEQFNSMIFWSWLGTAIIEGIVITSVSMAILTNMHEEYGTIGSFWVVGGLTYSTVIFNCQLKILTITSELRLLNVLILILSFMAWIVIAYIIDSAFDVYLQGLDNAYGQWSYLVDSRNFVASFFWMFLLFSFVAVFYHGFKRAFYFDQRAILQELAYLDNDSMKTCHSCERKPDDVFPGGNDSDVSENDIEGHELMRKTKREQAQLTANRKNNINAGRTTPARAIAGP
jgi:phospholipid-translocating P-type ATPase (flippase)